MDAWTPWQPIASSWIASARWSRWGDLEIRTLAGTVLPYSGVPEALFKAFLRAPSQGVFFNAHIKPGYAYEGGRRYA